MSDESVLRAQTSALLLALRARHLETGDHVARVTDHSLRLGRTMGLNAEDMRALELGAALHDIGKIGIRDSVLCKAGRLTEDEWAHMRTHPVIGAEMLRSLGFPEASVLVVEEHHERLNGTGYPRGLEGESISRAARIFAVADTFDAITRNRCYRAGAPYAVALHEIVDGSGHQFDPEVVGAFKSIPKVEWQ